MRSAVTRALSAFYAAGISACGVAPSPAPLPATSTSGTSAPSASARPVEAPSAGFVRELDVSSFKKGNVHTHSNVSDGDSNPETVVRWYRDHGYDFLAMTEHHVLLDTKLLAPLETERFRLVAGEEITMTGAGRQVHVNGLCLTKAVQGGTYATPREALDHAIAAVVEQGGVALVNHPNFEWALSVDDVTGSKGAALLEVASGHPFVNTAGDCDGAERPCHPSHESLWDAALGAGLDMAPVAVDDAHKFKPPAASQEARAGRAWIQVFSDDGAPAKICERLRAGDLYASTGAEITRLRVRGDRMTVWPKDAGATVEFVGRGGVRLERGVGTDEGAPSYVAAGGEGYVRARVRDPSGAVAYLPAVRVADAENASLPGQAVQDARGEGP